VRRFEIFSTADGFNMLQPRRNAALTADWKQFGTGGFVFEIIDTIPLNRSGVRSQGRTKYAARKAP